MTKREIEEAGYSMDSTGNILNKKGQIVGYGENKDKMVISQDGKRHYTTTHRTRAKLGGKFDNIPEENEKDYIVEPTGEVKKKKSWFKGLMGI